MKIYINSRGYGQAEDYHWHEIGDQAERRVSQPSFIDKFSHLLNRENFSVLLAFSQNQLLLLITALRPERSRNDITGSIIRNSLALVGDYSDEENLRSIAVSALRNELNQKLENMLEFGGNEGFRVKVNPNDLLNQLITEDTVSKPIPNSEGRIQFLSQKNQQELAQELQNYRLPRKDGALVVVTESILKSTLETEKVWRGLTSNFHNNLEPGNPLPPNLIPKMDDLKDFLGQLLRSKNTKIFVLILIMTVLSFFFRESNFFFNKQTLIVQGEVIAFITKPENNNITFKKDAPVMIEGVLVTKLTKEKDSGSSELIKIEGESSLQVKTISACIYVNKVGSECKKDIMKPKFDSNTGKWTITIKKPLSQTGKRTINLKALGDKDTEIFLDKNINIKVCEDTEKCE